MGSANFGHYLWPETLRNRYLVMSLFPSLARGDQPTPVRTSRSFHVNSASVITNIYNDPKYG